MKAEQMHARRKKGQQSHWDLLQRSVTVTQITPPPLPLWNEAKVKFMMMNVFLLSPFYRQIYYTRIKKSK